MPLFVTSIPIGNPDDLTLRAKKLLLEAPLIIGEERPNTERLLKRLGRTPFPQIEVLNEHSSEGDVRVLAALCLNQDVVLISDCGTPGFCDPGVELSFACRRAGTRVIPVPGASSLMSLLAVVGARFGEFHFAGFPPREERARADWIHRWAAEPSAVVTMDTPYRLEKFVAELAAAAPQRVALLGIDLTAPTERTEEGSLHTLAQKITGGVKGEFILCLYPHVGTADRPSRAITNPGADQRTRADQRPRAGAARFAFQGNGSRPVPASARPVRPKKNK